jgi:hypothetical protein
MNLNKEILPSIKKKAQFRLMDIEQMAVSKIMIQSTPHILNSLAIS